MAASKAVRSASGSNALGVIDDDAIGEVTVGRLAIDADVSGKPANSAFAVNVVGDKLIKMAACFSRDAKSSSRSIVQCNISKSEMMRVGNRKTACQSIAVDIAAFNKEICIVIDGTVGIENGRRIPFDERMIIEDALKRRTSAYETQA